MITDTDKLNLQSLNIPEEKREELLRIFPEVRTEGGQIDFDRLRLALGELVDTGKERYGLNWPGKTACFKAIQTPSMGTLLPAPEESVNFDTTENLIIEGDNLEVLKLLQKSYIGKVKMIYIDPPYNTGNDFIYPDNYSESLQTYLEYTGQTGEEGRRFSSNTDTDGRFHSKWLNMMYPRLYLARDLLRDDGVIFISIDDGEVATLRLLCDQVFGEENFVTIFLRQRKKKPSFLHANVGSMFEYVMCIARDRTLAPPFSVDLTTVGKKYPINNAGNPLGILLFAAGSVQFAQKSTVFEPQDMSDGNIVTHLLDKVVIANYRNVNAFRLEGEFRYSQNRLDEIVKAGEVITISKAPFRPNHVKSGGEIKKMHNFLSPETYQAGTNEDATEELESLFGAALFDNPKPSSLIRVLCHAVTYDDQDALVMDFFCGSGSTADAVMQLNAEDSGNRKFILVQLPEPTDRTDYPTIAEITKERVRRVIKKLNDEDGNEKNLDRGFRVFKLAESNFTPWDGSIDQSPEALSRQMEMHIEHVRQGRTDEDILYEILLKSGFPLSIPVETLQVDGKTVYSIHDGIMLVCLDRNLTMPLVQAIVDRLPERVVFLDEGFAGNDALKVNAKEACKLKNIVFKVV
ncbi:site-specific DNA-methyltransferase [Acidithiobacillus ferrooxidans]|uniref:site-specific DNA-methyltransferase n=1 Tax=Acidithiobacillus ferrooxidans TaxID=920 RepID=UPI000AD0C16A|nr:site-specific DNA-methyltransferase [Acidithiobacillus ferrooxidans]